MRLRKGRTHAFYHQYSGRNSNSMKQINFATKNITQSFSPNNFPTETSLFLVSVTNQTQKHKPIKPQPSMIFCSELPNAGSASFAEVFPK